MAKLKMIKYPKKPKQSASIESKERYLARVREIDKENAKRKAENKKSEELSKKIAGIRQK
jgi:predicted Holliday junction resolvase-like endonuclease